MTKNTLHAKSNDVKRSVEICTAEGCGNKVCQGHTYGLCKSHRNAALGFFCSVDGCGKPVRSIKKMLCSKHLTRHLRYGGTLSRTNFDPNIFTISGDICRIQTFDVRNRPKDVVVVDTSRLREVEKHKWAVTNNKQVLTWSGGSIIYIQWLIVGKPESGHVIDHISGDRLDNRLANLRVCTLQQNNCNKALSVTNTSGFKGVSWDKQKKKWVGEVKSGSKRLRLGYFKVKEDAARAYDEAAIKLQGEYARTNEMLGLYKGA